MTDIDAAVHALGGESNKVLYDDIGMPSIMVEVKLVGLVINNIQYDHITRHPAFVVGTKNINKFYVSKYQNVFLNERAYSLPLQVPETRFDFDNALSSCFTKGRGWHLMTNAEWAYLALRGFLPKGNNNSGSDFSGETRGGIRTEKADFSLSDTILTGSGPISFAHDGKRSGIWDLNGNGNEWIAGLRLYNGEIQIIDNNDAADSIVSQCPHSEHWKALLGNGSLADPNTEGTVKLDYTEEPVAGRSLSITLSKNVLHPQTNTSLYGEIPFENLTSRDSLEYTQKLKILGLAPWDDKSAGYITMKNIGERMAVRGGGATDKNKAGIRSLGLNNLRYGNYFAFRSCFIDILDTVVYADEDGVALATETSQTIIE